MVIFSLDLSITSTGYATIYFDEDKKGKEKIKVINYGKIVTKPKDYDGEDSRINDIVNQIKAIMDNCTEDIDLVAIENQFISARTSAVLVLRKLLGAVCRMVYHEKKLSIRYIAPLSAKKYITGSGKSSKEDIAEHIRTNIIDIGEFSDKGKNKTSDIYDAISVGIAIYKETQNRKDTENA